jgi:hypothetical protein
VSRWAARSWGIGRRNKKLNAAASRAAKVKHLTSDYLRGKLGV